MAINLEVEQTKLRELVKKVNAKERHILSFSIVFTVLIIAGGAIWIAYSVNKVLKLEARRATLQSTIENLEHEVVRKEDILRGVNAKIEVAKPTLDKIAQGKDATRQEAKTALAALSNAQERVQTAIDPQPTETSSPHPTASPTVPDVKGLSFAEADRRVRQAGLEVRKVDQEGRGTLGTVLYQDPLPGRRVSAKALVSLYVIPETPLTAVPDLKGLSFVDADQRVRQAGLKVRKVDQEGRGTPGTVLYQDPLPGKRVRAGTTVSLYVIRSREQ